MIILVVSFILSAFGRFVSGAIRATTGAVIANKFSRSLPAFSLNNGIAELSDQTTE